MIKLGVLIVDAKSLKFLSRYSKHADLKMQRTLSERKHCYRQNEAWVNHRGRKVTQILELKSSLLCKKRSQQAAALSVVFFP